MVKTTQARKGARNDFASLRPSIKNVKESTIRKKWKKLPKSSQIKVEELLRTIERPCLTTRGNGKRGANAQDAQDAVGGVVQALIARIPKMPFPPQADESFFEFDTMINRQRVLEDQLTANTHTASLLRAEVDVETELLAQDKAELEELRNELSSLHGDSEARHQRLHPIVQDLPPTALETETEAVVAPATLPLFGAPADGISILTTDPSARDVLVQLNQHFDSMQKNIEGMSSMSSALSTSQAALDLFNWKKLGAEDYRKVYGLEVT